MHPPFNYMLFAVSYAVQQCFTYTGYL